MESNANHAPKQPNQSFEYTVTVRGMYTEVNAAALEDAARDFAVKAGDLATSGVVDVVVASSSGSHAPTPGHRPFTEQAMLRLAELERRERVLQERRASWRLAPRHIEVIHLLAEGWRNGEIAGIMGISPLTVSTYVNLISRSMKIPSSAGTAGRAKIVGLYYGHDLTPTQESDALEQE